MIASSVPIRHSHHRHLAILSTPLPLHADEQ
ncbi:MAG: hypothetical protein EWM72_02060 [Nitrospira sp.]|nr:MAG: hypothetical protein EWM72_02060 [Nitrospira sp.]